MRLLTVVAITAASLLTGCSADDSNEGPETASTPASANVERSWTQLPAGWSKLEPPPIAGSSAVSLWIGDKLFYWGGDSGADSEHHADGAVYDASTRAWDRVPLGPLDGRSGAAAVWTGKEALVWGGEAVSPKNDGAAYDPAASAWRPLAPSPLSPRRPVGTVWTGEEMLVWGDTSRATTARDGAAYDPATDRWRRLPPAPLALNQATVTWTGEEMIVFGSWLDNANFSRTGYANGIAYDPRADRWRTLAGSAFSPQASSIAWIGRRVLAWDYRLAAGLYDPAADEWSMLPPLPLDDAECYPQTAHADRLLLAWYCGAGALFDPTTRRWRAISRPPHFLYGSPVSAGSVVLFAGSAEPLRRTALWAYKPLDS